ncbi:MAG TPA: DUF4145 domain-containing protein [Polyangia bacterium]|nr:DUF4145 domain-containing protein [Polyangia bacterium]
MRDAFQWKCPYCQRHASITTADHSNDHAGLENNGPDGHKRLEATLTTCPNPACRKYELRLWLFDGKKGQYARIERKTENAKPIGFWRLIPDSAASVFPDYVPEQIRNDYTEGCRIVALSPKAAATLARRALQGMIRHVWKIKKKNLAQAIEALRKHVDPETWKAIDGVRTVGNIGAHMEKDVNLIVDVDPTEAQTLLTLIEALVQDWYIKPHERSELFGKVAAIAQTKAAARKAPSTAQAPPAPQEGQEANSNDAAPAEATVAK